MFYIKERTSKGSAGPFIEAQRKGSVEPQYENGIRGNASFDSADPPGSKSEKFVRDKYTPSSFKFSANKAKIIYMYVNLFYRLHYLGVQDVSRFLEDIRNASTENVAISPSGVFIG
jgi:hypothetical protein